jgi:LacI family transcriptional regulator
MSDREGPQGRRATLADIAHAVGVSEATVSRALRDDPQIGDRTRATVQLVAAELEYVPNHAARSLARSATLTLGLMVPDVVDPMHGLVVRGFEQVAEASGYAVLIISGFRDETQEARGFGVFRSHQVDAVALCGTTTAIPAATGALGRVPVMFIGPEGRGDGDGQAPSPRAGVLLPDDEEGMARLVEHLLSTGRSRLSYLNGHAIRSNEARRRATAAALEAAGLEPRLREFAAIRSWRECDRIVELIAREQPDAIVCYDDESALHLLAALRAGGLRVPQDVAVSGFDDIPFAEIANPALTTVAQPVEDMGARAARSLLETIGSGRPPASERIPLALRIRESTAVAPVA